MRPERTSIGQANLRAQSEPATGRPDKNMVACPPGLFVLPLGWYVLLAVVAACGMLAWWIRHFTERVQLMRVVAIVGSACMLTLLIWTWQLDI